MIKTFNLCLDPYHYLAILKDFFLDCVFKEDVTLESAFLRGFVRTHVTAEESLVATLEPLMFLQVLLMKVHFVAAGTRELCLTAD